MAPAPSEILGSQRRSSTQRLRGAAARGPQHLVRMDSQRAKVFCLLRTFAVYRRSKALATVVRFRTNGNKE